MKTKLTGATILRFTNPKQSHKKCESRLGDRHVRCHHYYGRYSLAL